MTHQQHTRRAIERYIIERIAAMERQTLETRSPIISPDDRMSELYTLAQTFGVEWPPQEAPCSST